MILALRNRQLDLSSPKIMGILNVTKDSYCHLGRYLDTDRALIYAHGMEMAGASIIDVGAEPTNPSLSDFKISEQEEVDRLIPVLELLIKELDTIISVDTSSLLAMKEARNIGVHLINDVRALMRPGTLEWAVKNDMPVCLMHMLYPDGLKSSDLNYQYPLGVLDSVYNFLNERQDTCISFGMNKERILLDPGIGGGSFGKSADESATLIYGLNKFLKLQRPLVVGLSRKSFIGELLSLPVEQRLPASLAASIIAIQKGASIIRTHDVKETKEAIEMVQMINTIGERYAFSYQKNFSNDNDQA